MKTYQAIFDENKTDGVFGISLVHDPAMEQHFIALANHNKKIEFKELDSKKYILAGLVLEPDKKIYRNQGGEEFNMFLDEKTVEDLCYNFSKQNYNSNSTVEHEQSERIEGVTFVENWLVRDEKIDTATALGLNCKKGSWVTVMKCDNKEIYEAALAGEIRGFSIDAMLSLKEVNLKSNINMSKLEKTLDSINTYFASLTEKKEVEKEVEVKLGMVKSADGEVDFEFEGDSPQAGGAIWVNAEDGTKVPVPAGEYPLEDGSVLSIQEDGVIASIGQPAQEEAPAEMEAEPSAPSSTPEPNDIVNRVEDKIKSIMIKYTEELEELKTKNVELEKQVLELSKEPVAKSKKTAPVQVELGKKLTLTERLNNKL